MPDTPDHVESGQFIAYMRTVEGVDTVDPNDPLNALILAATRQELRKRGAVISDPATYEVVPSTDLTGQLFLRIAQFADDTEGPNAEARLVVMQGKEDGVLKLVPSDVAVNGAHNDGYAFAGLTAKDAQPLFKIADALATAERRN